MFARKKENNVFLLLLHSGWGTFWPGCVRAKLSNTAIMLSKDIWSFAGEGLQNGNGTLDPRESSGTCAERGICDSVFARSSWHACAHVSSRTWKLSVRLSTSLCLLCWQNPSLPDIMHTVWGWSQCVYKYWCEVILTITDAMIGQLITRQGMGASFLSQHLLRGDIKELQVLS